MTVQRPAWHVERSSTGMLGISSGGARLRSTLLSTCVSNTVDQNFGSLPLHEYVSVRKQLLLPEGLGEELPEEGLALVFHPPPDVSPATHEWESNRPGRQPHHHRTNGSDPAAEDHLLR